MLRVAPRVALTVLLLSACGSRSELLGELGGGAGNGNGNGGGNGNGNGNGGGNGNGNGNSGGDLDGSADDGSPFLPDGAPRPKGDAIAPPPNPCAGYQAYAPWPAFQRCSAHVGRTEALGPKHPTIRWQSVIGQTLPNEQGVVGPPTIAADGTIYCANLFGEVVAFNPDGTTRWLATATYVQAGPSAIAVGADGSLYVELDQLYAISSSGTVAWTAPILPGAGSTGLGPATSSVTLSQTGVLYIGTAQGLVSVDPVGGHANWTASTQEQGWTAAIDQNGMIYSGNDNGELVASKPDGTTAWRYKLPLSGSQGSWIQASPVIAEDGTIYFGAETGYYAFSSSGKLRWSIPWTSTPSPGAATSVAIGGDGTIYLVAPDSTLRAISSSGKALWSLQLGTPGSPPVIDGNGTIYLLAAPTDGGMDQSLVAVTSKGSIEWQLPLPHVHSGSLAVSADGTIYAATMPYDVLYAIGNGP